MDDAQQRPQSLGQLLGAASDDLRVLASQTLALCRLELKTAASTMTWSAAGLACSVLIVIAGLAVSVSALVLAAIALGLPAWAAATLVGLTLTILGTLGARYFFGQIRGVELTLKETRDSLRETVAWLNRQTTR